MSSNDAKTITPHFDLQNRPPLSPYINTTSFQHFSFTTSLHTLCKVRLVYVQAPTPFWFTISKLLATSSSPSQTHIQITNKSSSSKSPFNPRRSKKHHLVQSISSHIQVLVIQPLSKSIFIYIYISLKFWIYVCFYVYVHR